MVRARTYSDEQLLDAVACSSSWRGVLRALSLAGTSAAGIRSVRARADEIGADYRHFRGQRRWTEKELRAAVAEADTWTAVAACLGLEQESDISLVRGHAARLGLDLSVGHGPGAHSVHYAVQPDLAHLGRAGTLLAAAWFTLCGHDVSWPFEPCRYDLLVETGQGIRRVQVKTTTVRAAGSWKVYLSTSGKGRRTYDPEEIDDFFVVDGELGYYLIPVAVVGGLHAIHLRAYEDYRLSGPAATGAASQAGKDESDTRA